MPAGPTVSALIAIPTLRYAESRGITPSQILEPLGLSEADLEGAEARLPFDQYEALTWKAVELTGDPNLGLHVARHMSAGALGILGFVLMNCRTLEEALEKYCRYQRVAGEGIRTTMERQAGEGILRFAFFENGPRECRPIMEGMLSSTLVMMSALCGQPIRATAVSFTAASPGDESEHTAVFQSPVHFNRSHNALVFPISVFECRITQPSRELLALFEKHTLDHLRKLDDKMVYARKVSEECARMLQGEVPNIDAVAQKLAMSPRNLQLKLRQEGTSYRETLDQVRKDMAVGHLRSRQTTVAEVAYLLGFSEPSVFHRTFKRWTGSTPRDFRQERVHG